MQKCSIIVAIALMLFISLKYKVVATAPLEIINGTTAEEGEFPYMVQLLMNNQTLCGGSIIGSEWILTTGLCLYDGLIDTIIYGTIKTFDAEDVPQSGIAVKVINFFQHPDFQLSPVPIYDVGLLQLEQPIIFSETVQPIKIAEETEEVPFHVDGVLSGWGCIDAWNSIVPEFLQKTTRQFLTDEECIKIIDDYVNDPIFLPIHHLCTNEIYYDGVGDGDYGSPFVINSTQFGILSWSIEPGIPSAYTRITNPDYREWIRNITSI